MKAFKVELLIIDFDKLGEKELQSTLENTRFPNDCINPKVMKVTEVDIGEWDDDHPLNHRSTIPLEYKRLFG